MPDDRRTRAVPISLPRRTRTVAPCLAAVLLAMTGAARAQPEGACRLPERVTLPASERGAPSPGATTDYYALALSWSPTHCLRQAAAGRRAGKADGGDALQCRTNRFGFIVHGLWPQDRDGRGSRGQPAWCAPSPVSPATARTVLCMMPSPFLVQHEWDKHGSCAFGSPEAYYDRTRTLWTALDKPDARALADALGADLRVRDLVASFVSMNARTGLRPEHVAVQVADRQGTLKEVFVCYDRDFAFTPCLTGRTPEDRPLRVPR